MNPEKIGRYLVEAELGRGGMATVYRARDPRSEREVAVKVLPPEMLHDPQFRVRFEREAKTIAKLEHPAIVPVYDFGEDEGQPYFVMRYMTGGSLSDRLKNGPITIPEAYRLFARIAPALDSAHSKGIIHRDLKPANILFDQYGEPYISDFGIAKLAESQGSMTGSGIVGTPAYMSPEQAQGEGVDSRSDIYGLGVILFEALTGRQPYSGETPMSVVVKHITDPVPHILDVKPDLPIGIEKIVEKALAKDKNERFATSQAFADALGSVSRGETLVIGAVPTETRMAARTTRVPRKEGDDAKTIQAKPEPDLTVIAPRKRSLAWVGILVAVFAIFALAAGGLFLFRDRIPFLAAPAPTEGIPPVVGLTEPAVVIVNTPTDEPLVVIQNTITPAPTDTPTLTPEPRLPVIGGADLIAFINAKNVWLVGADGADPRQLTTDGVLKQNLQWAPDGKSLLYIVGTCIQILDIGTAEARNLACFTSAELLDDLSISPDGTQVAISLDGILYVVPYDQAAFSTARDHDALRNMMGCFTYDVLRVKAVRFSADGKKIAVEMVGFHSGIGVADVLQVFDISACNSTSYPKGTIFPMASFVMDGYRDNGLIPSFDWNKGSLFLLNTYERNESYGYMYSIDIDKARYKQLDPLNTSCCYSDPTWSPDGSYVFFSYQNKSLGSASVNELYYIPYGTIGSGTAYSPILPPGYLVNNKEHPEAALRPAR